MKNIAIIPARSGSKGVPDKNIKLLNGKPLMAYTIEAAIKSKMFDTVMVSTDSERYANIACQYGAEVPFFRSEKNSSDKASSWDTVMEVLENYKKMGKEFDTFMLLQPTSPLRNETHICEVYTEFESKNANAVVSVCEVDHSPLYCNTLPKDLSMDSFLKSEVKNTRRQDLDVYYRLNGAIYLSDIQYFLFRRDVFADNCYAYVMNKETSIDIDDEMDFIICKSIIEINL